MQQQRRDSRRHVKPFENVANQRLANGLGWFSIGMGLAEVMAPSQVAQLIGVPDQDRTRGVLRAYGCRKIASGIGILAQPGAPGWVWGRVAGDLMDLGSLMSALNYDQSDRKKVATATAAVLGVTVLDVMCAQQSRHQNGHSTYKREEGVRVAKSITVNRPVQEVFGFWNNLENLPSFMHYLDSVRVTGQNRSHWKAKAPGGMTVEWEAETVANQANQLIAWRSIEGSEIHNCGSVRFERGPAGRGTVVKVDMEYAPPGGSISSRLAKLFGKDPMNQVQHDLRAFKQVMETGEVMRSDASIHRGMHPARPDRDAAFNRK